MAKRYLMLFKPLQYLCLISSILYIVVVQAATAGSQKKKSQLTNMTLEDFLFYVGMFQLCVIGPMLLYFVINVIRDPAFVELIKNGWTYVRSRTMSDLSMSAPIQHSNLAKDARYMN